MSGNSSLSDGPLPGNLTEVTTATPGPPQEDHTLVYVLIPLGSLFLVIVMSLVIMMVMRKSKLERLRHHLMPMYSFDPADEDEDWESELLEDPDKEQQSFSPSGSSRQYNFMPNQR